MFRSFIWESGRFFDRYDVETDYSSDIELNGLLESCIKKCYLAAKDTINSISNYVSNCEIDIVSSWYATYFIFQAVLIPILLLYKRCSKRSDKDLKLWVNDIEQTKETLISLQGFNSLAKNLVETINILTKPIIKELNELNQDNTYDNNRRIPEMDTSKDGFEFADLPSATINLFSNVGVDFSQSTTDPNVIAMRNERFDKFMSNSESNDSQFHDELLTSEEAVINSFLQQELFPNDPIFEKSQQYQSYNLRGTSK